MVSDSDADVWACANCEWSTETGDSDDVKKVLNQDENVIYYIGRLPSCNFCDGEAHYDGATNRTESAWYLMCQRHFEQYGLGLGIGVGQKLEVTR